MRRAWKIATYPITTLRTATFVAVLTLASLFPMFSNPRIASADSVVQPGTTWLNGGGVDIMSGGDGSHNCVAMSGAPSQPQCSNIAGKVYSGDKWQCVEMVNRLYLTKGWTTSTLWGNGSSIINDLANHPGLSDQLEDNISYINIGDVVTETHGTDGHAGVIDTIDPNGTIHIKSQNADLNSQASITSGSLAAGNAHYGLSGWVGYNVQAIIHHPSTANPTPPTFKMTSSTEDAPMAGDLNGDGNGDVIMAVKHANDNGVDLHVLFGANSQPFQYTPTLVRTFAAPTWDINRMKFVVGRFNSDQYADLAVFYRQDDGISTSVYIFYGAPGPGLPLQSNDPPQHYLLASDGWNWNTMKLVSGDVNGDGYDDVVVAAKLSSGGAGFHVLTGGVGNAALNNQDVNTSWRDLPAPAWYYDNMKLAAGPFNADNAADVAIVYNNAGINLHILNGGAEKFTNASTLLQTLPSGSGWNWNLVKLAAGQYNDDVYADLVLLHKDTDGGMAVHTFYGSGLSAAPFSSSWLPARTLTGTPGSGWSWDNVKLESGPVQMDNWSDIVLLHRNNAQDIDVHVLYGNPGNLMFNYNPTFIKEFTQAQGYNWSLMTPS